MAKMKWVLLFSVGLAACSGSKTASEKSEPSASSPTLVMSMHQLKISLESLLPILVDSKAYNDPKQRDLISEKIRVLDETARNVSHDPVKGKMDPSFGFLSEGFSQETRRARSAFESGKTDFARYALINLSSYCIECHTRSSSGPSFDAKRVDAQLAHIDPLDRAEYLLATRRFDEALAEFQKIIKSSKNSPIQFLAVERAVRHAMAITVKFQQSPEKTEKLIADIESSEVVPFYLKQSVSPWRKAVARWKQEKRNAKSSATDLLKGAEALVQVGHQAQMGISDRSGDVDFLRALSSLHKILLMKLTPDQMSAALYTTGKAYEAVGSFSLWNIHDQYYEGCIRKHPHSSGAKKCYAALEESLYQGFTGSAGTAIPVDEHVRLKELARLAEPETAGSK